jgi:molybdate transport system substrate-binding protein
VRRAARFIGVTVAAACCLARPSEASAQLKVIVSGGFAGAYQQLLPEFERVSGITVSTGSGASQGTGPDTIGAQLRRGVAADVVILSREGLDELIASDRILKGSDINLARTLTGLAVRAGAAKPDISTVDAFTHALLGAKAIAVPGSTTGIYLTKQLFPKLGVKDTAVRVTSRGADSVAMVARGEADFAIQPASELARAAGVDLVGPIPQPVQFVSVFSAAIVANSTNVDSARRLIVFLSSESAAAALRNNGMEPPARR